MRGDAISSDAYSLYLLPISIGFAWCAILGSLSKSSFFRSSWIHIITDMASLGWAAYATDFYQRTLSVAFFILVMAASIAVAIVLQKLELHASVARSKTAESESLKTKELELKAELARVHTRLAEHERVTRLISNPQTQTNPSELSEFIGSSLGIKRIFSLVERVAPSDATVLVTGESGTGKELVAKALHRLSPRNAAPFVAVNCGAIPAELLESELFGHKKGSFTGASADTLGMFRQANGGTIFLDEVGELPLVMQVKILRTLQERVVRPVGGNADIPVDVRLVTATNRHLRTEVTAGRFREDLFFRINVINIHLPPLRDRVGDIELLIAAFIRSKAKGAVTITPAAMDLLNTHSFPGNVRELENIIERALVLGGDVIAPEHLPELTPAITSAQSGGVTEIFESDLSFPINLERILEETERKFVKIALERCGGTKKQAADALGINLRSLRYRAEKLGL